MTCQFLVIGGGIAGASAGYHLARHGEVVLLEMEQAVGYHATGRSAALFSEYYGPQPVRALTAASRSFLASPPSGFAEYPLLSPRGVLTICPPGTAARKRFEAARAEGLRAPVPVRDVDPAEVTEHCPIVRPGWCQRAMLKPGAQDIDVDALHQGFLRGVAAAGGRVVRRARVRALRRRGGRWHAETEAGTFVAPVVVNAAGAWADEVALLAGVRPVGLIPLRRTAFLVDAPAGTDPGRWPMVADVTETFYLKPESGQLLVSPADATPSPPVDARPDDLDVALAVERVQEATTLRIRHVRRAWAGLRTATPDDLPVLGPDPARPGFVWFAGLGGYGVQLAPAAGRLVAALATGGTPAEPGIDPAPLAPGRRRPQPV